MRTPANIAGHPIHPMLVTIPIGLWLFSLVADLIGMRSAVPDNWAMVAYYTMIGGIVGGVGAALFGMVDLASITDPAIKRTGRMHMVLNLVIVALYIVNAWMRHAGSTSHGLMLGLSVLAIVMLAASGWLGGKMVYLFGVAVDTDHAAAASARNATRPPQDRSGAWTGSTGAGAREHAMASDATRPSSGPREDRPAAGRRPGDASDKTSNRNR